jgi:hypothetical protein
MSAPKLIDVTWRLGVTASTSETNASGATRVTVRFTLEDAAPSRRQWFETMEMSVTEFYELTREFERARDAVRATEDTAG